MNAGRFRVLLRKRPAFFPSRFHRRLSGDLRPLALAGPVVDHYPRLDVEDEGVEAESGAAILDGQRFDEDAARHQVAAFKDGRHSVKDVIS